MADIEKNTLAEESSSSFDKRYRNQVLVLFTLVAAFVIYIDTMLTPSLPKIASQYGVTISQVSLIISLYTVLGTAINPIVGKLGDIYGKKRVLMYVLLIYLATVSTTSFAPNFIFLIISRTAQGIGLGMLPLAFSLVREQFPREQVPRAEGLIRSMFIAGAAVGLSGGAYIANAYGWQANYHIAIPFLAVLTILIFFIVKESAYRKRSAKMDYIGAGLLGLSLTAIVLGLSEGSSWGWTSESTLGLVLGGFLLLIPLVAYERKVTEPILNMRLLSLRNVALSNILGMVTGSTIYIGFLGVTYKLELVPPSGYGFNVFSTGIYLLPLTIALIVIAYPVGVLVSRFGVKPFLYAGGAVGAIGFLLISIASNATELDVYLVVAAAGMAMIIVPVQNLLVLSVRKSDMGVATSLNTSFATIGQSLGAPIAGSILSTFVVRLVVDGQSVSIPSQAAFQYSFYIAALGLLLSAVLAIFAQEVIGKKAHKQVLEESNSI